MERRQQRGAWLEQAQRALQLAEKQGPQRQARRQRALTHAELRVQRKQQQQELRREWRRELES